MQNSKTKIKEIVKNYKPEVYKQTKQLNSLISDYFPQEEIGDLLKIIINQKASLEIYNLALNINSNPNTSNEQINVNYKIILDKLSKKTFIDKDRILPATDLLCYGLDINVTLNYDATDFTGKYNSSSNLDSDVFITKLSNLKTEIEAKDYKLKETPISDFKITLGTITKYLGNSELVVIPNGIIYIAPNSFFNCTSLKQIIIPHSVNKIGVQAFKGCSNLMDIDLPFAMSVIDEEAFMECTSLQTIYFSNIVQIKKFAFSKCSSLENVIFTDSVFGIENSAFSECYKVSKGKSEILALNKNAFL